MKSCLSTKMHVYRGVLYFFYRVHRSRSWDGSKLDYRQPSNIKQQHHSLQTMLPFPLAGSQSFEAEWYCYREGNDDDDDDGDDDDEDDDDDDDNEDDDDNDVVDGGNDGDDIIDDSNDDDNDDSGSDSGGGGDGGGGDDDNVAVADANNTETLTADGLRALKNDELREMLKMRGMIQQGKKEEMVQRILNPVATDFKRTQLLEPWKTSKAKALLFELINNAASSVHQKSPEEVWESSEWFKKYPKHRFVANMKALQTAIETQGGVIAEDIRLVETELAALNLRENTKRGYPHWHKHNAKQLLAEDIKQGRNSNRKPRDFQTDRSEYQQFPLAVFRGHIYQENRKQREMPLKINKRNKLGEKKHLQEAEAEALRWNERQNSAQNGVE